jgi:hypothetical protein
MRYGIRTVFAGMTQEQYDAMHAEFAPLASSAPGFVAHIAGPTEGGWYLTEVWDSKADHERFMQQHVFPKMPPDAPRPSMEEFDVYSRQTKDQLNA